jgi:hypothetical protein
VLKLCEETTILFCVHVLGMKSMAYDSRTGDSHKRTLEDSKGTDVHLRDLTSIERGPKPSGPYRSFDKDSDSMESQSAIIKGNEKNTRITTDVDISAH